MPQHVAIVMDGNGRWAKERGLERAAGHKAGVESCRRIVKACAKRKINVLSVFAFSSENWRRPIEEVNYLMSLFLLALSQDIESLHENNIKLRFIGDLSQLDQQLQQEIKKAEKLTQNNTGLIFVIATNYGGQWDILQASQKIAVKVAAKDLQSQDITVDCFKQHLVTHDLPDPDLLIRTSGCSRISNFYLWQLSYTELFFTDVYWPDFNEIILDEAIANFQKRERRFGFTSEQIGEYDD